ncbi:DUF4253 domain-containing protein [Asanoa sp. NPDC050611]|uniref:DUF4253 domain-containing protein n=1 Tax=Asanoa sp. NPDC050611 TaxID=3157098 RepID=UPI0033FA7CE7
MTDLEDIEAAFEGGFLGGLPAAHGPAGTVLIADVEPTEVLETWQAAHALIAVTGRWPLLVADEWSDCVPRPEPDPRQPGQQELAALDAAARTVDPWTRFEHWSGEDGPETVDEVPNYARGYHGIELGEDVLLRAPVPSTGRELERWVYDRVLADPALAARVRDRVGYVVRTDYWFTPSSVTLALLPAADPWLAARWISFHGAEQNTRELAAVLWQWHRRWDARPVASWGTMLQFTVERPPAPGDDAWAAAGQILGLAGNLSMARWELAAALPGGPAWFLHNRP